MDSLVSKEVGKSKGRLGMIWQPYPGLFYFPSFRVQFLCHRCIVGVSSFTSVQVFLDGYFGFCLMHLFSSPIFVCISVQSSPVSYGKIPRRSEDLSGSSKDVRMKKRLKIILRHEKVKQAKIQVVTGVVLVSTGCCCHSLQ
jgi:hypothetical protein